MKIWILRPLKTDLWKPWYDKAFGFIIAAETEEAARLMAQSEAGLEAGYDESIPAWTDPLNSTCIELVVPDKAGTIMRDFASA